MRYDADRTVELRRDKTRSAANFRPGQAVMLEKKVEGYFSVLEAGPAVTGVTEPNRAKDRDRFGFHCAANTEQMRHCSPSG